MTFHNVSIFNKSGIEVDRFQTMSDAITYIDRHSLGADWATPSLPEQHTEDDELLLLAFTIRGALRPHWRHAQFDRLMSREITHLPDTDSITLEALSAFVAGQALAAAGIPQWNMAYGAIEIGNELHDHAWLVRDDGRILDFMADRRGHGPIMLVEPWDELASSYSTAECANFSFMSDRTEIMISTITACIGKGNFEILTSRSICADCLHSA